MKNASKGSLLFIAALMLGIAGCASTGQGEKTSTGQGEKTGVYVDDSWITTKVKSELVAEDETKARNIKVNTMKGVVTLTGTAETWQESYKAADLARGVKGVTSVENDIRVQ